MPRPKAAPKAAGDRHTTVTINGTDIKHLPPEETASLKITKIKFSKGDGNCIKFERTNSQGEMELVELPFYGAPHPDLEDAMNAFIGLAVNIVGLNDELWLKGETKVSGITLKHVGFKEVGLIITMQRRLADPPDTVLIINTPFIPPDYLSTGDEVAIAKLHEEAILCLKGKRAQMNLLNQEDL